MHTVTVSEGNQAPVINSFTAGTTSAPSSSVIDYVNALAGDTLVLHATATDPNAACGDSVVNYQWTVNGHTTTTQSNSLSLNWATLQSAYEIVASGTGTTYPISVKATDTFGADSSAAVGNFTIYQNLIVPDLVVGAATCSQPASFNAAASHNLDPRFAIVSYAFDFGDASPVYTETAATFADGAFDGLTTHTYAHAGVYSATVTVIDGLGQSANTSVIITVT